MSTAAKMKTATANLLTQILSVTYFSHHVFVSRHDFLFFSDLRLPTLVDICCLQTRKADRYGDGRTHEDGNPNNAIFSLSRRLSSFTTSNPHKESPIGYLPTSLPALPACGSASTTIFDHAFFGACGSSFRRERKELL